MVVRNNFKRLVPTLVKELTCWQVGPAPAKNIIFASSSCHDPNACAMLASRYLSMLGTHIFPTRASVSLIPLSRSQTWTLNPEYSLSTHTQSETRRMSGQLLYYLTLYTEQWVTSDAHSMLAAYIKSAQSSISLEREVRN